MTPPPITDYYRYAMKGRQYNHASATARNIAGQAETEKKGSVANKPDTRSSMLVDWPNSIITGGCSDQIQSVQMATPRVRNHSSLRPLVFTLRPQLSRPRRNDE